MNKLKHLIDKFWSGDITKEEAVELNELLHSNNAAFQQTLEAEFQQSISLKEETAFGSAKHLGKLVTFTKKFGWWAAASILIMSVGAYIFMPGKSELLDVYVKHESISTKFDSSQIVEHVNTSGSVVKMYLPDSSLVSMWPGSTVSHEKYFTATGRNISFSGRAIFNVHKDAARPFVVTAGGISTTALGTQFEVNTTNRGKIKIQLIEGKVMVETIGQTGSPTAIFMRPGQSVFFDAKTHAVIETNNNAKNKMAYVKPKYKITNDLVFDNDPLLTVFEKIKHTYDLNIHFKEEELEGLYFTGSITSSDNVKDIISIIADMNGLKIDENSNQITIHK